MRFFKKSVKWYGRIIDANGVAHDPDRIRALIEMPDPVTAQDIQQFLCAANWMRASIPAYNVIVRPLMELMEQAYAEAVGWTKRRRWLESTCHSLAGAWNTRRC